MAKRSSFYFRVFWLLQLHNFWLNNNEWWEEPNKNKELPSCRTYPLKDSVKKSIYGSLMCSINFYQIDSYIRLLKFHCTYRVSNKHGNWVTNSRSSLWRISIGIPDFKSPNINMYARVYFMKTVNGFKDVSILCPASARWTVKTDKFTLYTVIFLFY